MKKILYHPLSLSILFIINLCGTIYGYYWYRFQLAETPWYFLIFVPDSPTASLFFTIFLFYLLQGKKAPLIEALAMITLVKYGIWAVVMNILTMIQDGGLDWTGYMLIVSHGLMAVQAVLYASLYTFKIKHLVIAAIWTLHNDIIDYLYGMMPTYGSLSTYSHHIGYFTFWLSIACIALAYYLVVHRTNKASATKLTA